MAGIWTMGEILVEIMRTQVGIPLGHQGSFIGPFPSGAPAIFIDTAARLGHSAGIIGGVGNDDFGHSVVNRLKSDGVNCQYIQRYDDHATAVAFVTYFEDGSRKFIYHIDRTPAVWARFDEHVNLNSPAFFHVMGCSLMINDQFRGQILDAMTYAYQQGARISFDPNIRPELLRGRSLDEIIVPVLNHCTVLMPGLAELALLSGVEDPDDGARSVFTQYPIEIIVLKQGKKGCCVYTQDRSFFIDSYPINELDPTGAGDCFDAGFVCSLIEGRPLEDCAKIAAACGSLNASAFGPMEGIISRQNIRQITGIDM